MRGEIKRFFPSDANRRSFIWDKFVADVVNEYCVSEWGAGRATVGAQTLPFRTFFGYRVEVIQE